MRSSHKDLIVWQKSLLLAREVHQIAGLLPKYEIFGLTSQLRRSAVSVPSNIAEGAARQSTREFLHFLYVARGSLAELETQLHLAKSFGYIEDFESAADLIDHIGRLLNALIRTLRTRAPNMPG